MSKETNTTREKVVTFLSKAVVFVAVVAVTALLITYFTNDDTRDSVNDLLGLDPDATTEQATETEESSDSIAIPGFDKLVLEADSLTQEVALENPEDNDVYFIASLSIDGEEVYESKLIEPGKGIYSIELPKAYPAGEYSGSIQYETRSMSNPDEQKNGAAVSVPIIFQ